MRPVVAAMHLVEALEDPFPLLRRHAGALVFDLYPNAVRLLQDAHPHRAPLARELHGVVHEVAHRVIQHLRVRPRGAVALHHHAHPFCPGQQGEALRAAMHQRAET